MMTESVLNVSDLIENVYILYIFAHNDTNGTKMGDMEGWSGGHDNVGIF